MRLEGKVVILTGASRGIGATLADALAERGAHVVLAARDGDKLDEVAARIETAGGEATAVPTDVTRAEDRARLLAAAEAVGPIDVIVHNAGVEVTIAVSDQTEEDVERQIAVNLLAPIQLTRAALPAMRARGAGTIVMVSSMSGKSPTPYNAVYAATKHGLNGFAASLRLELEASGVHAGVVCPSFVADAGMWADSGGVAPKLLREVPLDKVVEGVFDVIGGATEVLVTPTPIRPLLALSQLFPRLDGVLLRRMGVLDTLRERAEAIMRRR